MARAIPNRALTVTLLAATHLAIVGAVLAPPLVAASPPLPPALMVTAIPAPGEPIESAPPPLTRDIVAQVDAPAFEIAASDAPAASGPCSLVANVESALRQDAGVGLAVARIPTVARSVSNALLLWDGKWARPDSIGGSAAMGPIRATIEAEIRAAPAACRAEPVVGPRLVVVPDGDRQIVLAFGSGQWAWGNML